MARPTKYTDDMPDKIIEYFHANPDGEEMPTITAFALREGVSRDTLHEWSKAKTEDGDGKEALKYPKFSDAYKKAIDYQEKYLVNGALSGGFNPTFSIFFAKNRLGWKDKREQELTGKDGGAIKHEHDISASDKLKSMLDGIAGRRKKDM